MAGEEEDGGAGRVMCSWRYLHEAVEAKAAEDMSHCVVMRVSASNRLNISSRLKCFWALEKFGLWANFCGSSPTIILSISAHSLHVYSLCKVPLLGGGGVSRLSYTYIIRRHFHTMCPAPCGGIWGFTQAFSLPAHKSCDMTCYKSGACIWLTSELAVRGEGCHLVYTCSVSKSGYVLDGKYCSSESPKICCYSMKWSYSQASEEGGWDLIYEW